MKGFLHFPFKHQTKWGYSTSNGAGISSRLPSVLTGTSVAIFFIHLQKKFFFSGKINFSFVFLIAEAALVLLPIKYRTKLPLTQLKEAVPSRLGEPGLTYTDRQ